MSGFIKKLSKEKGLSEEKIEEKIEEELKRLQQEYPDRDEAHLRKLAETNVKTSLERSGSYSTLKIAVLGKSSYDMIGRARNRAKEAYKQDPDVAVAKGLTDEEGRPLWTENTFTNMDRHQDKIGTPLPKSMMLWSLYGVDIEDKRLIRAQTSRESTEEVEKVEVGSVVELTALKSNSQSEDTLYDGYSLDGAQSEIKTLEETVDVISLLESEELNVVYKDLSELREYIKSTSNIRDRVVITSGFATRINRVPIESTGSRVINIDEAGSGEQRGVTCWIPPHVDLDFGQNSIAYVIGRASLGSPWGDSPVQPVNINVYGLVVDPEFREPYSGEEGYY